MKVYHQYTAESDNQHLIQRRRGWLRLSRSTQSVFVEIIGCIEVVARFRRRRSLKGPYMAERSTALTSSRPAAPAAPDAQDAISCPASVTHISVQLRVCIRSYTTGIHTLHDKINELRKLKLNRDMADVPGSQ